MQVKAAEDHRDKSASPEAKANAKYTQGELWLLPTNMHNSTVAPAWSHHLVLVFSHILGKLGT